MKRKINLVGNNTLTVSLPSKWVKRYNLKKGDEVEVGEDNKLLIISPKIININKELKTTIDVSHLDSSTILHTIQVAYRIGYDEIQINFTNETTHNPTRNFEERVVSVIKRTVDRLIGFEIVDIKPNLVIIKGLSESDPSEFNTVSKRTIFLFLELTKDVFGGITENNEILKRTIQEQHDNLTKFVSLCLRLINKSDEFCEMKALYYHIYSEIDKIADVYKYLGRDYLNRKLSFTKVELDILNNIKQNILQFCEILIKFDMKKINEMSRRRGIVINKLNNYLEKSKNPHLVSVLSRFGFILELLVNLTEIRIGIYLHNKEEMQ